MPPQRIDPVVRFWRLVDVGEPDECWLWLATKTTDGYGSFSDGSRRGHKVMAHRFAYQTLIGPIPDGLQIDHLCRVRACVNPTHMEPVTPKVNSSRGEWAKRTQCPHGHPYTPENTRWQGGKRHCRECGRAESRRGYWRRKAAA